MLYKIAHFLRDNLSFIWDLMEWANSIVFGLRYSKTLKELPVVLKRNSTSVYSVVEARLVDATRMASFFAAQPESDYAFFKPHGFDEKSLRSLLKRTSFMMFLVEKDGEMVGYFFLRSFCHGQAYLGKMVDHTMQGKGIGKLICKAAMDISVAVGLRMFESINKKNVASMKSSSVLKQVVVKELEDGDLLIEDLPLNS